MAKSTSSGQCNLCNHTFSKAAMTRHLRACAAAHAAKSSGKTQSLHLVVQGGYPPIYWLHLAAPADTHLSEVDDFLRRIWLECCHHMSAFTIDNRRYSISPMEDDFSMDVPVSHVLRAGSKIFYEYDFGSITELFLKIAGPMEIFGNGNEIQLLARNDAPAFVCIECGDPATQVCTQCMWEGEAWFCDDCTEDHECGEEAFLPVVNSPRVGVCGYGG